jgi:hypothetical protein
MDNRLWVDLFGVPLQPLASCLSPAKDENSLLGLPVPVIFSFLGPVTSLRGCDAFVLKSFPMAGYPIPVVGAIRTVMFHPMARYPSFPIGRRVPMMAGRGDNSMDRSGGIIRMSPGGMDQTSQDDG